MLCRIAGLTVSVPDSGDMAARCAAYRIGAGEPEIVIRGEDYYPAGYPSLDPMLIPYLESGWQFYESLLRYDGMMLHASAVAVDGKAYCFSGPCGTGKSTHTALWQKMLGEKAVLFNDDKPALRRENGVWYAYGTPWAGKNGLNVNLRTELGGICFLRQAKENQIRRMTAPEIIRGLLDQTLHRLGPKGMECLLDSVSRLIEEIPVFELENRPEIAAARLSYETMRAAAGHREELE